MPSSALNAQSCLSGVLSLLLERPVSEAVPRNIGQLSAGAAGISSDWPSAWPRAKSRDREVRVNRFMTSIEQPKKPDAPKHAEAREPRQHKIQRVPLFELGYAQRHLQFDLATVATNR